MTPTIVAIDGPAGSGKSTVTRILAERLGWQLLDTGSVYRALTWYCQQQGIDLTDAEAVLAATPAFLQVWELSLTPGERWVRVDGIDVTDAIRATEISNQVSHVAGIMPVRAAINQRFREILHGATAAGIVTEGRDMTTVVVPDATVRILLTADESVRIQRRQAERGNDNPEAVARSVALRDAKDGRVTNFTEAAPGVDVIDSTHMDLAAVTDAVLEIIAERTGNGRS
ncbi:(d)CMP kinase [Gulosibacter bifidus]|uniref:Cytidylate kinase n=1 Tax=Gulosibacter bifidus TaxID=272239 RepID=A0ABW5RI07_9MICO|nr:(d)CMP kinase [Gulosibacter bifidus]